mgnify:CR=1 FL=1
MYIDKNTYIALEQSKDAIVESLHDYLKNIYYMKALSQALGPTFPGNTSPERIQLLNIFYLNAFNSLLKNPSELSNVKAGLKKLIDLMLQDYRSKPDIFNKIIFVCGMFKEHFDINLAGIPSNMLQYIYDNLDMYAEGIREWGK